MDDCAIVVDVTRVQIYKPKMNQQSFYSPKDKFHALKFEVACTIEKPRIVWVNGGFPGNQSDLTIARDEGLGAEVNHDEMVLADLGYRGFDNFLWTAVQNPRVEEELESNHAHHQKRQVIERINKRIKQFDCFAHTWRHDHAFCKQCFNVVCKITNLILVHQPLNIE